MVKRSGDQFYEMTSTDGVGLRVSGTGLNFKVPASIDVAAIALTDGVQSPITKEMMSGSGSYHQVNIHCFYAAGAAPGAAYTIEVADLNSGTVVDNITAPLPAGVLPLEAYYQLILWIA